MPKEESNQVSGLINFVRNIGGSILIAITNAQVTTRAMWHEQHLQQSMQPGSIGYQQHLQRALPDFSARQFGRRQRRRHGAGNHLQPAQPAGTTQGYQDVYMELSLDVGGADRAGFPARTRTAPEPDRAPRRCTEATAGQPRAGHASLGIFAGQVETTPCSGVD